MPIYEYRCAACGFQNEYLQKVTDPILAVCPECGKDTFKKLVTAAGFQLKGSGWYATDFKHSGSKPGAPRKPVEMPKDGGTPKAGEAKQDGAATPDAGSKQPEAGPPACGAGGCPACS